ncbi:MAG: heme-dependent oxidative N-demethylase subunit alpha family protein, partial [Tumebacillaceae bacterium]
MTQNAQRFPFPFESEHFSYSNNLKPLTPPLCIQITNEYVEEMTLKRTLLEQHHNRSYHSLPGTLEAQWEVVELLAHQLAAYYPERFSLEKDGETWTFTNHDFAETTTFRFRDASSLPCEPLDFIGRQVQEDLILMSERDH